MRSRYALLFLSLFVIASASAQDDAPRKLIAQRSVSFDGGGGCDLGTAEGTLDVGGVGATLFNSGAFFWRGGDPNYEVPRGYDVNAIFTSTIWFGGEVDGQDRFAGSDYGPYEYWPGPLDASGQTDPATCAQFDRIWNVRQADIEVYAAGGAPTADMTGWPIAWGAPFYVDANGNSQRDASETVIELDLGDAGYGTRQIDLGAGERPLVYGSQTLWWVMNDAGNDHDWSESAPLGIEVRVAAFGVSDPSRPELDRSTFYRFSVHNRSNATINDGILGFWADTDLGFYGDDFIGSDASRGMLYTYNGDEIDEFGYGFPPPALGIDWLSGAASVISWNGDGSVQGNPSSLSDITNYLHARWRDGSPLTEGGTGYNTGSPTNWMYNGDAATQSYWSEEDLDGMGTQNIPADRRGLISAESVTLAPGASHTFDLAIVYGQGADRLASITALREADDAVQTLYDSGALFDAVSPSQAPLPAVPASAPSLVTPADGTTFTEGSVPLSWTAVMDAEWYVLQVHDTSLRVQGTAVDLPPDFLPTNRSTPIQWSVRAANRSGEGPGSETRTFTYYIFAPGFVSFQVVANAAGPLIPPTGGAADFVGFPVPNRPGPEQQVADATWFLHTGGEYSSYDDFIARTTRNGGNWVHIVPFDFEARFTAEGSIAAKDGIFGQSGANVQIPFEIWRIGADTPDDPSDDVRMIPLILDIDNDGTYNLSSLDSPISGALNDPYTDWIYWYTPVDMTPGESGYNAYAAGGIGSLDYSQIGAEAFARTVFVGWNLGSAPPYSQPYPEQGTIFRILTSDTPGGGGPTAGESGADDSVTELTSAYPNPTRGALTVAYRLAEPADTRVAVFDALGREVAVLARGARTAGPHQATLDTATLAPGIYTVLLEAGDVRSVQRVAVIR